MKLSVIIPVYNTAAYLRRCLDSVINQTMRDIEIILASDGPGNMPPKTAGLSLLNARGAMEQLSTGE